MPGLIPLSHSMPNKHEETCLILDRRDRNDLVATCGATWRVATDTVMGGMSSATLTPSFIDNRGCLCLSGSVSLQNNGGFVQASLDLTELTSLGSYCDASKFAGVELEAKGDGKPYNVHLRTRNTNVVWQSYRAGFIAPKEWRVIRLPFDEFVPYKIDVPLDISALRKLGVVSIGKEGPVRICIGRLAFYPAL
jgi:hypothetical protein